VQKCLWMQGKISVWKNLGVCVLQPCAYSLCGYKRLCIKGCMCKSNVYVSKLLRCLCSKGPCVKVFCACTSMCVCVQKACVCENIRLGKLL